MTVKRQFIAGGQCPDCGSVDKIQRCQQDDRVWIHCVACGMERDIAEPPPADLPQAPASAGQPVRWLSADPDGETEGNRNG